MNRSPQVSPITHRYRSWLLVSFVVLMTLPVATRSLQAQGRDQRRFDAAELGWMFDYRKAQRQARRLSKPMMVVLRCAP